MLRKLAAAVVLMLLFSVMSLTNLITPATANPFELSFPSIRIISPPDPPNRYENSTVSLEIDVLMLHDNPELRSISYSLDGAHFIPVSFITLETGWSAILMGYTTKAKVQLTDLSEGNHKIVACAKDAEGKELVKTSRSFTVNSHYQVTVIEVLSPQHRTYSSGEIPLVFTVNGEFSNGTYHILKPLHAASGIGGTKIEGNTTLTGLPDGSYQVLLYLSAEGKDASRAYAEFIVNSAESTESTNLESASTLLITVAFFVTIGIAGVALWAYSKRIRHPKLAQK